MASRVRNVGVRRLTIQGPLEAAFSAPAQGVALTGVEGGLLEGVDIESHYEGVAVGGSRQVLISGCRTRGCSQGYAITRSESVQLVESHALEGVHGLFLSEVKDTSVMANIFWRNRGRGISMVRDPEGSIRIHGNVVSFSGESSIALDNVRGASLRGNVVHNASLTAQGKFAGVLLAGSSACRIVANRIGDELYDPFQTTAIKEDAGADENVVQYNVVCPINWPPSGKLDNLIATSGKKTVAADNVLYPYPPVKQAKQL